MPLDATLPWDFVNVGVGKDFLYKEYQRMLDVEFRETCTKKCNNCGGCDFEGKIDGQIFARNKPLYQDYHINIRHKAKEELYLIEGIKLAKDVGTR